MNPYTYRRAQNPSPAAPAKPSLGGSVASLLQEALHCRLNPLMAFAMVLMAATAVLAITMVANSEISSSEGGYLGKLASHLSASKVLGTATYGYNEPICNKYGCLNYQIQDYQYGYFSARIDYTVYGSRYRSIRINGNKFANNLKGTGSVYTGYSLNSNATYSVDMYSGSNGSGVKLLTMIMYIPSPPTPTGPMLQITSPVEEQNVQYGTNLPIYWQSSGVSTVSVFLTNEDNSNCYGYYCQGNVMTIYSGITNNNMVNWGVSVSPGNYRLTVSADGLYLSSEVEINVVNQAAVQPRVGAVINKSGAIYLVDSNGLYGFPDEATFTAWGYSYSQVVEPNSAESALTQIGVVPYPVAGCTNPLDQIHGQCGQPSDSVLNVSLDPVTPLAATVAAGAANVPFTAIRFINTSKSASMTVTAMTVTRGGNGTDSAISSVGLYDGSTLLSQTTLQNGKAVFPSGSINIVVPATYSKTITIKASVASSASAGTTYNFGIQSAYEVSTNAVSVGGSFPVMGYVMTVGSGGANGGTITVSSNIVSNTQIQAGAVRAQLMKFNLSAGSTDVPLDFANFTFNVSPGSSFKNYQILINGSQSTVSVTGSGSNTVQITAGNFGISANTTVPVELLADVDSAAPSSSAQIALASIGPSAMSTHSWIVIGLPIYGQTLQVIGGTPSGPTCSGVNVQYPTVTTATGNQYATVTGVQNVINVPVAVYRYVNNQNTDLVWYSAVKQTDGTTWKATIDLSKILGNGTVYVDAYLTNSSGINVGCGSTTFTRNVATSANPVISVSPSSFSFTATQGAGNPAVKTLSIANVGASGSQLGWSVSSDSNWLTASRNLTGQTTTGTETGPSGVSTPPLNVAANISGLAAGSYRGNITIVSTDPVTPTKIVTVNLTVSPAANTGPICGGVSVQYPTFTAATGSQYATISGVQNVTAMPVAVYRYVNNQNTDLVWYQAVKQTDGTSWKATIDMSKILGNGTVYVDAYMNGTNGSYVGCGSTTFTRNVQ